MVHEALSRAADLGDQRVMLLDALRHQRGERSHRLFDPFGLAFRQYWKSQGAIRGSADR